MKKLLIIAASLLLLGGCAGKSQDRAQQQTDQIIEQVQDIKKDVKAKRTLEGLSSSTGAAQTSYATATPDADTKLLGTNAAGATKNYTVPALKTYMGTGIAINLKGDLNNLLYNDATAITTVLQSKLTSGSDIKTINGVTLLGSGDMTISGGATVFPTGIDIDGGNSTASFVGDIDGGASL